ncbi:MAG TPA: type I-F CRISPR-associated protein Csy1, partial [Thauera sp.]|nr:type I-F CRISPR-associated protein Csy1 [Thauera sp.]
VRATVRVLRDFLESDPPSTMETRNRRDALLDRLIDELVDFAHPLQATLPAGWTRDANCRLVEAERLWLDPRRAETDDETDTEFRSAWQRMEWPAEIGRRFGNWLNHELGQSLPLGDIEGRHWRDELLLHTAWAGRLHALRLQGDAPTYIPVREAVQ